MTDDKSSISRRTFVRDTATAAAAFAVAPMIVPRHVLGGVGYRAPSRTLNVAMVGFGGMGMSNMNAILQAGENVVAVCDIDYGYVERSIAGRLRPRQGQTGAPPEAVKLQEAYTKAKKYDDFRTMFDKNKDIDAVVIATPDHLHAIAAYHAMKAGKHVYVQKPLTYTVQEARLLAKTARDTKVVTQMGNQGHSMEGTRRINELIAAGVIGPVREVHTWTDRPARFWAQGVPRPQAVPTVTPNPNGAPPRWDMRQVDLAVLKEMAAESQTVPPGVHWDLFLGPTTREVAYHPAIHPFSWRGYVDFGVSSIGDMGAHIIDQPFWSLGLDYPTGIIASSTPWGGGEKDPGTYPFAMTVAYEFAARGSAPPVKLHWYDGGLLPVLTADIPLPREGGGGVFVGDKGFLTYETYGNNPKVYPDSLKAAADAVPKTFPRVMPATPSHEANWCNACKGEGTASSPFEYASKLTETMLLGIVALRAGQSRKILYDGAKMQVTNVPEANRWLTREYRQGWQPWSTSEAMPVVGG
jgi:predicted dehydrogenase